MNESRPLNECRTCGFLVSANPKKKKRHIEHEDGTYSHIDCAPGQGFSQRRLSRFAVSREDRM